MERVDGGPGEVWGAGQVLVAHRDGQCCVGGLCSCADACADGPSGLVTRGDSH